MGEDEAFVVLHVAFAEVGLTEGRAVEVMDGNGRDIISCETVFWEETPY